MTDTHTPSSTPDVVGLLKAQHEQVKSLITRTTASTGSQRQATFDELRRLLAVHEIAEEEIVHPRAKNSISHGEEIVDARLGEEHEAKKTLRKLEELDVESTQFEVLFEQFRHAVQAHAEAEEQQEFAKLSGELDDQQLQRMRRAVELAERVAPTHPHGSGESRAANLISGPFAAMLDRARDAIDG